MGYYIDNKDSAVTEFFAVNAPQSHEAALHYLLSASPVDSPDDVKAKCLLKLNELLPELPMPNCGRPRAVPRSKRNRTRKRRNGTTAARLMNTEIGENKRCIDHREWGLWAFDTFNSNVASTGLTYLCDTGADVVFLQELRVAGDKLASTQRQAARTKWSLAVKPAKLTEANAYSAGVGVAVRSHMGHSPAEDQAYFECCKSRVVITHLGAVCKGGIFLVSVYLWCSEGASTRNLEILQAVGQRIRQLRGPWVMAADFNLAPDVLTKTGWLQLVQGVVISSGQATCKGVEDDYFVVDKRLKDSVVGVAGIHDTGSRPHSAVRMWMKGNPRREMVRSLSAPKKAEAAIPSGCLPREAGEGWADIADLARPAGFCKDMLERSYCTWVGKVESLIADMHGWDCKQRQQFCVRAGGPRFVTKSALGPPGCNGRKFSPITGAWGTVAGWLTTILQAFSALASPQMVTNARKAKWLFQSYSWSHLGECMHASAFCKWVGAVAKRNWDDRASVHWYRATAVVVAARAKDHDTRKSNVAWTKWLCDGPAKSLGRHHKLTRVATGWVPSACAMGKPRASSTDDPCDDCDDDDITQQMLDGAEHLSPFPLSSQLGVDVAATAWGKGWKCGTPQAALPWPDLAQLEALPELTVDIMNDAAGTFPDNTGLGWDDFHPKAVRRCGVAAVRALIRILIVAESLGDWPAAVGVIMVCLLP